MAYLKGIPGLEGLGALPSFYSKLIQKNRGSLKKILKRAEKLSGLGNIPQAQKKVLTFNEMVKLYNAGITEDEIKAWVWYRRSVGIAMKGWEKYYLDSSKGEEINLLTTKQETLIKDNHFRDLKYVPAQTVLGKKLSKTHTYGKVTYQLFRDNEGIRMVDKNHIHENNNSFKTDPEKLEKLVLKGALFYLNGELLPYPVYAYGNMYDRELQLEKDKNKIIQQYGIEIYENHKKLVAENKPVFLSITNPDPKERPKILSISKFSMNTEFEIDTQIEDLREETGIVLDKKTSLFDAFKIYLRSLDKTDFEESTAYNIIYYYLDNRNFPRDSTPEQKAELKRTTRNEGERLFDKFLHEALTSHEQQKLDFAWNRMYNGQSNLAHHKIPIGFEACSKFQNFNFELRPAQREGIAFMEMVGSGIIGYDVGVGKTITAIAEIANSIHSGKCKRPLIVVPNPTYQKWIKEIIGHEDDKGNFMEGILAGTGIKLNDWYNLGTSYTRKILDIEIINGEFKMNVKKDKNIDFTRAVPEKSITIVTYEGFKRIGFGDKVAQELFYELVNILHQSNVEKSARDTEIEYQKYKEKIGVGLKDTIADIDVLGFDYMVMDEAHNCKNIFNGVKKNNQGNKRFGMSGAVSDSGIKAFFLTNYLQRKYGRNVMLLTATPFTNSPLEIYSMLSLVAYQGLRDMKIYNINDFFERHVQETTEDVINYKEEIVQKDVVKSFNNRLLLQKLIYNHINYKTGEEAGVRRPCKINLPKVNELKDGILKKLPASKQILTYLKMTNRQRNNQNDILKFARLATAKGGEILKAMNYSMNNAFHPCLFDNMETESYKEFVEESPKIKYTVGCIQSVKKYHEQRNEAISGQVIYSNRGKDYFHFIKEYLEKEAGYKKDVKWNKYKVDEVEIIDSSVSRNKKEKIKDAFLEGFCKIIIGTATIREGIDLQKKGTVIYNLYPDWNPTDIRQLEGRVWRQKNEYGYVRVVMPLVQDSMDVFVFQKLEEKTSRINDIWYRGDRGNVLDLESLDPEEVKFALLTDEEAIAASIIKKEVKKQERKINHIESNIETLKEFESKYQLYEQYKKSLEDAVKRKFDDMAAFDHIRVKPSKEKLNKYDKESREKIKKDIELFDELRKFIEKTPYEDKELIQIARKLDRRFDYFGSYAITRFKDILYIIKKAERTVLASKGYTLNDDIEKVLKDYRQELDKENKKLEDLKSENHKIKVQAEVKERKSAMKIQGKSIDERINEFKGLNHLLSYKFSQIDPQVCIIPDKELPPEENPSEKEKTKRIRIARVKAQAKLKLLQLLEI